MRPLRQDLRHKGEPEDDDAERYRGAALLPQDLQPVQEGAGLVIYLLAASHQGDDTGNTALGIAVVLIIIYCFSQLGKKKK